MRYLAHISEDGKREQSILEHSGHVADMAGAFAAVFGCRDWGYCCGKIHDIGKYSEAFDRRLHGGPRVDHATAGAKELLNLGGLHRLAAYCVAGHHSGLPDMGKDADGPDRGTLKGRSKKQVPDYQAYKKEISIPPLCPPPVKQTENGGFSVSFFIRMIYSCLVDADFLDTEDFMTCCHSGREPEKISEEHLERLKVYISGWLEQTDVSTVNGRRTQILRTCLQKGYETPGLFRLTVPTGGGKTVSSLAFALQHASHWKKDRIIYVIPYTSIIEQNAAVFRKILGDDQVLEHHSSVNYDEKEELHPMLLAAENWDKPVIVTTNVQFFESLFSNKPSQCRKLHNLANSVIILDEAQMLPQDYLKPCLAALTELAINYRCSVVLCTATQPPLETFFPRDCTVRELCPDVEGQFRFFRRTVTEQLGILTEEHLARRLNDEYQALCIVNNRKRVQNLFDRLKGDGIYHLSTLMYPEHRKRKLEEIRGKLKGGERCVVVATSLVEAGVDLDFLHVYRELAGTDSVAQAAGRCNREGKHRPEEGKVFLFEMEESMPVAAELKQSVSIGKEMAEKFPNLLSPEAVREYFRRLYCVRGEALDKKGILEELESHAGSLSFAFATVADEFHLIEQRTKTVLVAREEPAKELTRHIHFGEYTRKLMREISHYSVQVYEQDYEKLRSAGYLETPDGWENELAILRNPEKYSEEKGLIIDVSFGDAVFV